ncbi:MAG: alginate export family protein [Bacteroidales bacterium]|nr:alginate export family protein [Bacteroidales bacterium]
MKTAGRFAAVFILTILVLNTSAQFSLTGELRPRAEYRNGFSSLIGEDEEAAFFISQRSRLNFRYDKEELTFFVSLQDVRVWGEVPQLTRSDVNSSIHEAWGELRLSPDVALRLGRQELVYDNARMLGNVDWAQQGRSHDLALLKWNTSDRSQFHAGFAFNQEGERRVSTFYTLNNYKTMQFLWFNQRWDQTGLSLLFLNNGMQGLEKTHFSQTTGGRLTSKLAAIDFSASAFAQTGRDAIDRKLSAFYLAAEGGYNFSENFKGALGFEFLSGTDLVETSDPNATNRSFNPLYGTNHAFNGHMDYFYVGNHINNVGLINPYITTQYAKDQFLLQGNLHMFFADGVVHEAGNPETKMSAYLGTEIDLILGYNISPNASIRGGYSHLFASETMERIKGGDHTQLQNWMWVMVILKPTLFSN